MKRIIKAVAVAVVVSGSVAPTVIGPAFAERTMSHGEWIQQLEGYPGAGDHPWVYATIRRINKRAGTLTITHDPIPHAGMPSMTMTFPVANPADLTAHPVGSRVEIQVDRDGDVVKILHVYAVTNKPGRR